MQILVTLVVLTLAVFLVGFAEDQEATGAGLIGGIVGYWLR